MCQLRQNLRKEAAHHSARLVSKGVQAIPPFADADNVILVEPRIARNEAYTNLYTHLSAILGEATVFCVTGGHRG